MRLLVLLCLLCCLAASERICPFVPDAVGAQEGFQPLVVVGKGASASVCAACNHIRSTIKDAMIALEDKVSSAKFEALEIVSSAYSAITAEHMNHESLLDRTIVTNLLTAVHQTPKQDDKEYMEFLGTRIFAMKADPSTLVETVVKAVQKLKPVEGYLNKNGEAVTEAVITLRTTNLVHLYISKAKEQIIERLTQISDLLPEADERVVRWWLRQRFLPASLSSFCEEEDLAEHITCITVLRNPCLVSSFAGGDEDPKYLLCQKMLRAVMSEGEDADHSSKPIGRQLHFTVREGACSSEALGCCAGPDPSACMSAEATLRMLQMDPDMINYDKYSNENCRIMARQCQGIISVDEQRQEGLDKRIPITPKRCDKLIPVASTFSFAGLRSAINNLAADIDK